MGNTHPAASLTWIDAQAMTATPACAESVEKALGGAASEVTRESCVAVLKETMGTIEPYLSTALVPTETTEGEGA